MVSISSRRRWRQCAVSILFGVAFVLLPLLLAACGGGSTGGTQTSNALPCSTAPNNSVPTPTPYPPTTNLSTPQGLITPGTLTVGSDTTYPPQEYIDTATGNPTGFDIDLITAMAQKLGLKTKVVSANFDTILDDLNAKRFDTVISAITINSDRLQKANFIPYFNAGESLIVQQGNPLNIKCVPNLCGLKVGVQSGTVELDDLNAQSKACTKAGKPAIQLTVLTDQTDVIQLLVNHRVDATYQDSPVTDYYIKQNPGQFEIGGTVVNAAAEGIAVRKDDSSLLVALQAALSAIRADGTYDKLFAKWQLNAAQKLGG
ncbi:MAG TPA: ABC transporter substrate-binding protein [Ktedonobacteraceae bacterium]|jgi:polar amino acid transport system substrate-binding protein|nr:ABC transporter substrate-binding protein [Ktedonobacteraceae bacterium]